MKARSLQVVLFALGASSLMIVLDAHRAHAKGGSNISVTTTAAVGGTVVSGIVTIGNAGSNMETVAGIRQSLEVRFPSGSPPPALPAGSESGWYNVATLSLASPGGVPANGTVSVPYSNNTCGNGARAYPGAKDMRSVAVVTVAAQSVSARSPTFALPAKCPVCGNGLVEAGEQCDGGACCSTTCRFVTDGTACNDGNACTQTDWCQAGSCVGGNAVSCTAASQCQAAGTCDQRTGLCSNPAKPNGTPCDDGNACTQTDSCQSGICMGGNPITCAPSDQCHTGTCDPQTGSCSQPVKADGTECADGNACTVGDSCVSGDCTSGAARDCDDHMICTDDNCAEATGCAHTATSTCDVCDSAECGLCKTDCDARQAQCGDACWATFLGCLNHCTTTYCAPFCQLDYSRCLDACPATEPCQLACEAGNGCTTGCVQP
jgi:hypothetical protein